MKTRLSFVLALILVMGLFTFGGSAAGAQVEYCGEPEVVTLWAGQTIDAGTVTVANDENYLYVTFTTANGWLLSETHLHVAASLEGIPQTNKGNPKIGNFAYQTTHNPYATEFTYTIAKADLPLDENNSTLVIAAHAAVVMVDGDGNVIASETGWGDGEPFVERGSWAMYFQYTWQDCNGGGGDEYGTETAFAYGGDYATCFLTLDLNGDGTFDFNRWGWTNGPLAEGSYVFDIYAGAGQCDLDKGTFVGTLTIEYYAGTAEVTYLMTETDAYTGMAYTMIETHLYAGSDILPTNNGAYTVAPGQYPTIHGDLEYVTSDSYTITGLSGEIYVVAHATVYGFPVE